MNAHTPLTHCRTLHGTPRTRALDAMIARADRTPSPRTARTPAHFDKLVTERGDLATAMVDAMAAPMRKLAYAPTPIADEEFAVLLLIDGDVVQPMEGEPGLSGLSHAAAAMVQGGWGQPEMFWHIQCQGFTFMSDHTLRVRDAFEDLAEAARRYCDTQGLDYPVWADEDGDHAAERGGDATPLRHDPDYGDWLRDQREDR